MLHRQKIIRNSVRTELLDRRVQNGIRPYADEQDSRLGRLAGRGLATLEELKIPRLVEQESIQLDVRWPSHIPCCERKARIFVKISIISSRVNPPCPPPGTVTSSLATPA